MEPDPYEPGLIGKLLATVFVGICLFAIVFVLFAGCEIVAELVSK